MSDGGQMKEKVLWEVKVGLFYLNYEPLALKLYAL